MILISTRQILVFSFLFVITFTSAQQIIYGANDYIEYQVGTLPLVISVSHGGELEPSSIPDRTCNNPVYAMDAFTIETAIEIKNKLFELTGCYPHLIVSHLRRNKLDPNRNLSEAACGNGEAITAWFDFHGFIADAREAANLEYNDQTFFVDLHGHGNPIQRIELGYLLYDDELELPDNTLNTSTYVNYSSILNLVQNNVSSSTHAQLLRGSEAFGTLLSDLNYPSVPSQSIPFPGLNTNYFSGGYITVNHTSYNSDVVINGFQMELNYDNIRDTPNHRQAFANAFSQAFIQFMNTHFNMDWNTCQPLSALDNSLDSKTKIFPNPINKGELLYFKNDNDKVINYQIFNVFGQLMDSGKLGDNQTLDTQNLAPNLYFLKFTELQTNKVIIEKFFVQ